jgi:hypothetical protein
MFIQGDNIVYAQIGLVGNIYYWNSSQAVPYTRLRDGGTTVSTTVNPYGSANLNGLPLINTARGIFSLGKSDSKMPIAQSLEYVSSLGQGTTAGALAVVGSQVFSGVSKTTSKVIDKISTNKYSSVITTPVCYGKLSRIELLYSSLPTGTSISAEVSLDGGSFTAHTLEKDDANTMYRSVNKFQNKSQVQVRITLNASTTTSPSIYQINIRK